MCVIVYYIIYYFVIRNILCLISLLNKYDLLVYRHIAFSENNTVPNDILVQCVCNQVFFNKCRHVFLVKVDTLWISRMAVGTEGVGGGAVTLPQYFANPSKLKFKDTDILINIYQYG